MREISYSHQCEYVNRKRHADSYFSHLAEHATSLVILFAMVVLSSCGHAGDKPLYTSSEQAVYAYKQFGIGLCDLRKVSIEQLCDKVREWTTMDSVVTWYVYGDSTKTPCTYCIKEYERAHDTILLELNRLILSDKRTYKDVVLLMEAASPYMRDSLLHHALATTKPFFASLRDTTTSGSNPMTVLRDYNNFLNEWIACGIHSKEEMLAFIKGENEHFNEYLTHMHELEDEDLNGIILNTERCCQMIFRAEWKGEITELDALVYMTVRTNRRLIQNALTCIDCINSGLVTDVEQAQAFVWMILKPYMAIDAIGMALLYPSDRADLLKLAEETYGAISSLDNLTGCNVKRLSELPYILMNLTIANTK